MIKSILYITKVCHNSSYNHLLLYIMRYFITARKYNKQPCNTNIRKCHTKTTHDTKNIGINFYKASRLDTSNYLDAQLAEAKENFIGTITYEQVGWSRLEEIITQQVTRLSSRKSLQWTHTTETHLCQCYGYQTCVFCSNRHNVMINVK